MHPLTKVPIVIGSVLVLTVSSLLWNLNAHRRRFRALPKPPHNFLFGHLVLLFRITKQLPGTPPIAAVLSVIQSQYKLPDVFYLDLWPIVPDPFLVTGDLAVADRFLTDYTRHPSVLKVALQALTGGTRGLVSSDMSEWYSSRTAIRTVFSVTNVQRFVPDMAQYSMELRAALLRHAKTGRRFPMIEPIEKWGADLTFRFLLGEDAAVQQGGWGAQINADVQTLIAQIDSPVSWNPWTYRERKKALSCSKERVRSKIRTAFNDALRKERPAARNQFVPLLDSLTAKYVEEYPGRKDWDADTMAQHLDTMVTMFLAADVSSMVLTYVFCHVAQDPAVAAELRKEHNAVFPGDADATLEAIRQNPGKIKELPYTTAVIKESMRLRPPGLSPTIAPKGQILNYEGVEHSLEGKMLFTSLLRLQSNSSYISSPFTFDPTRWLPTPSSQLADAWRPFQRGRHSCMGENMMMPGLVIALLLTVRDIDVALAYDDNDVSLSPELGGVAWMDGSFAAKPAKGLPVTVKGLLN